MTAQHGEAITTSSTVVEGGTIQIQVGPNDSTVQVSSAATGASTSHDVPAGKSTLVRAPTGAGTIVAVSVGKGLRKRVVLVQVVSPPTDV